MNLTKKVCSEVNSFLIKSHVYIFSGLFIQSFKENFNY
jgi:hypothetical protein